MTSTARTTTAGRPAASQTVAGWFVAFVVLAMLATGALAQGNSLDEIDRDIRQWKSDVADIQKQLQRPGLENEELNSLRSRLETLRTQILRRSDDLRPRLDELKTSLEQLGPAPDGGAESPDIANQRRALQEERERVSALQKQLDLLSVQADQLSTRAAEIQHARFFRMVFETSRSALNPLVWIEGASGLQTLNEHLSSIVHSWWSKQLGGLGTLQLLLLAVKIAAAVAAGIAVRRILNWLLGPNTANVHPSTLERLWRVFRAAIVDTGCTLLVAILLFLALDGSEASDQARRVYWALVTGVTIFVAFRAFSGRIFAPGEPNWRITPHDDALARRMKNLLDLMALVIAVDAVFQRVTETLLLPVQLSIVQSAATAIAVAVLLALALLSHRTSGDSQDEGQGTGDLAWVDRAMPVYWVVLAAIVLSLVLGFVALAHFLAAQVFVISTLVVVLYLLHRLSDELVNDGLKPHRPVGRFLRQVITLRENTVDRFAVVLTTFVDFALVFVGLPVVFAQTAVTWIDIQSWINSIFFGFQIGGVTISISTVVTAVLAFFIALGLTKLFTRWLDARVLSRTQVNKGIRDSIRTGVGYMGFLVAAILALSYAGVNFDNIALVAGALGVGIGFGLQSIVNNFVSGLILLAERPIKVGDWIKVSGGEGYVKRINVRSTEIETFEKCSIIVPNSNLISEPVQNWTHSDTMGRVTIRVGVSYGSDPEEARAILLDCARAHDKVLAFPAPAAYFVDFGASSLDFLLFAYIGDVNSIFTVGSDLRFAIFSAFREKGIEIPFPQHDIHLRSSAPAMSPVEPGSGTAIRHGGEGPEPLTGDPDGGE